MTRLDDLRDELYRRQSPKLSTEGGDSLPLSKKEEPVERSWAPVEEKESTELLHSMPVTRPKTRWFSGRAIFTAVSLLVVGMGAFVGYSLFFVSTDVRLSIQGTEQATAGEISTFAVRIVNKSSATLKEGVVTLTFPTGTTYVDRADASLGPLRDRIEVPDIPPGGEFQKDIQVRLIGVLDESETVSGFYVYRPEDIQSKLTRQAEFKARIARVPVAVTVDTLEQVNSGQEISVTVAVDSEFSAPFSDTSLGIEFPPGFEFLRSDPPLATAGEYIWNIGDLQSGVSEKIVIRGRVKGEPEEVKAFRVRLGRYDARTKTWLLLAETSAGPKIASPFLLARTALNGNRAGSIAPGDRVDGNVFFKNNLPQKIQNVIIAAALPENLVELQSIRVEGGFYDVTRRALVWNSSSDNRLKELDSGEEGTLAFSFNMKKSLPVRSFSDKNFVMSVTTVIDSATPPPDYRGVSLKYQDSIEFKVESHLGLSARAAYYDSPSPNSGPLPPKVRETTTYTIYFQLSSGANDLRDVEVRATLPGGVAWKDVLKTDIGVLSFNEAANTISWKIPTLAASTGLLRPPLLAIFRVAITPADNQATTAPDLVQGISASATDSFSGTSQNAEVKNLTINLPDDPQSNSNQWRVVK